MVRWYLQKRQTVAWAAQLNSNDTRRLAVKGAAVDELPERAESGPRSLQTQMPSGFPWGKKGILFCWLSLKGNPYPKKGERKHH